MSIQGEQILLRAYLESADRTPFTPAAALLVREARRAGLAGATVLRGVLGFVGREPILRRRAWSIVERVPVIVEIVDSPNRIADFVAASVNRIVANGIVTLERAYVMMYRQRQEKDTSSLALGGAVAALAAVPHLELGGQMKTNEEGTLLRVFVGESDVHEGRPLYEVIVERARALGLAGATVLRGSEGFGANSVVHKAQLLDMSTDLPIVIEIVDAAAKIDRLLPELDAIVHEGMITMEHVRILVYRHNPEDAPPTAP